MIQSSAVTRSWDKAEPGPGPRLAPAWPLEMLHACTSVFSTAHVMIEAFRSEPSDGAKIYAIKFGSLMSTQVFIDRLPTNSCLEEGEIRTRVCQSPKPAFRVLLLVYV